MSASLSEQIKLVKSNIETKAVLLRQINTDEDYISRITFTPEQFTDSPVGVIADMAKLCIELKSLQVEHDLAQEQEKDANMNITDLRTRLREMIVARTPAPTLDSLLEAPSRLVYVKWHELVSVGMYSEACNLMKKEAIIITPEIMRAIIFYEQPQPRGEFQLLQYLFDIGAIRFHLRGTHGDHQIRQINAIGIEQLATVDAKLAMRKFNKILEHVNNPVTNQFSNTVTNVENTTISSDDFHFKTLQHAEFKINLLRPAFVRFFGGQPKYSDLPITHILGLPCKEYAQNQASPQVSLKEMFARRVIASEWTAHLYSLALCSREVFDFLVRTFDGEIKPNMTSIKCEHNFGRSHDGARASVSWNTTGACPMCPVIQRPVYIVPTLAAVRDEVSMWPLITMARAVGNVNLAEYVESRLERV